MRKNKNQRGFVGLLSLLIAAAIIAFLAVKILTRLYRLPPGAAAGLEIPAGPGEPASAPRSAIDRAEEAKRAIEQRGLGI